MDNKRPVAMPMTANYYLDVNALNVTPALLVLLTLSGCCSFMPCDDHLLRYYFSVHYKNYCANPVNVTVYYGQDDSVPYEAYSVMTGEVVRIIDYTNPYKLELASFFKTDFMVTISDNDRKLTFNKNEFIELLNQAGGEHWPGSDNWTIGGSTLCP